MNTKQIVAILAPLAVLSTMYPIFQLFSKWMGETWGWYLGLVLYWILWGGVFPILMIGKDAILRLIHPQPPNWRVLGLIAIMILLAGAFKFSTGTQYQKHTPWILIMYLSTTVGNGLFEEILWRGMYLELFSEQVLFRIIWSSIWFGLWHFAPGAVSSTGKPLGLMIGAGMMGFYLSFLANYSGTIWWTMIAHFLGGILMVI